MFKKKKVQRDDEYSHGLGGQRLYMYCIIKHQVYSDDTMVEWFLSCNG